MPKVAGPDTHTRPFAYRDALGEPGRGGYLGQHPCVTERPHLGACDAGARQRQRQGNGPDPPEPDGPETCRSTSVLLAYERRAGREPPAPIRDPFTSVAAVLVAWPNSSNPSPLRGRMNSRGGNRLSPMRGNYASHPPACQPARSGHPDRRSGHCLRRLVECVGGEAAEADNHDDGGARQAGTDDADQPPGHRRHQDECQPGVGPLNRQRQFLLRRPAGQQPELDGQLDPDVLHARLVEPRAHLQLLRLRGRQSAQRVRKQ